MGRRGAARNPVYNVWRSMKQRCINPNDRRYSSYGGRGILVCDSWQKFENFYADMGERPSPKHSIDRKDNDGPYSPDNCRWATNGEQIRNTRRTKLFVYQGETMALKDLAKRIGMAYTTLYMRLFKYGWPLEKALSFGIREHLIKRTRRARRRTKS